MSETIEKQIVDELLCRLHRTGLFATDGLSDESIKFLHADLQHAVRLVLDDNLTSHPD